LAFGRAGLDAEQIGDLLVGIALHVVENEDLSKPVGEAGDRSLEVETVVAAA